MSTATPTYGTERIVARVVATCRNCEQSLVRIDGEWHHEVTLGACVKPPSPGVVSEAPGKRESGQAVSSQ